MHAGPQKSRVTRGRTLVWTIVFGACGGSTGHGAAAPASGSADQPNAATGAAAASGAPPARRGTRAGTYGHRSGGAEAARRSAARAARAGDRRRHGALGRRRASPRRPATRWSICATTGRRTSSRRRCRPTARRCPIAIATSFSARPTISSTTTASRCAPGKKNYLELYGIPPSLSVLRARFLQDAEHPCHDQESADALEAVETVSYVAPESIEKDEHRLARIRAELEIARRKAKVATLEELAEKQPQQAAQGQAARRKRAAEKPAMAAVERRLTCEGLLTPKSKHQRGIYDEPMRLAVRSFQQKHMIYESNYLRRKTVDALARPLLDNDYDGLVRALRERVVSAAAIIEDGTAGTPNHPSRDLVDEYTKAAHRAARARQRRRRARVLQASRRRGVQDASRRGQAAAAPRVLLGRRWISRSSSIAATSGTTCRSSRDGHWRQQPRKRYPHLTLFVTYKGQKIPLARWRTTIGGWRAEQASDGYEYYRYKMSDIGPRVIRQVVSGPVWIAPTSTPIRTLVKGKLINSSWMQGRELRRARPRLPVGVRHHRRLLRDPRLERQARLRQRRARARLVGLPVDLQLERLLARLPSAAEPPRDPHVLVHPAPSQQARGRRSADELHAPVPAGRDRCTRCACRRAATRTTSIRRCR